MSIFTYLRIISPSLKHNSIIINNKNMGGKNQETAQVSTLNLELVLQKMNWLPESQILKMIMLAGILMSDPCIPKFLEKNIKTKGPVDNDFLASRINTNCVRFASWHRDPDACRVYRCIFKVLV